MDLAHAQIEPESIPEAEAEDIFEGAIQKSNVEARAVENDLPAQRSQFQKLQHYGVHDGLMVEYHSSIYKAMTVKAS